MANVRKRRVEEIAAAKGYHVDADGNGSTSDYVVYVRHSSTASAASIPTTSASQESLAAIMRNAVVVFDTVVTRPTIDVASVPALHTTEDTR